MIENGDPRGWFRFHDLLRLYAEQGAKDDPAAEREAATERVEQQQPAPETRRQALAWLQTERATLVGVIGLAHRLGHYDQVLRLAFAMGTFSLYRRKYGDHGLGCYELALDAAVRLGDRFREAKALR